MLPSIKLMGSLLYRNSTWKMGRLDAYVLNMNGRVPDEGAMVEAGIAWNAGKTIVIYKDDSRSLINGEDNPLLLGLSDFVTISDISTIPHEFENRFIRSKNKKTDNSHLEELYEKGAIIASISRLESATELCKKLMETIG